MFTIQEFNSNRKQLLCQCIVLSVYCWIYFVLVTDNNQSWFTGPPHMLQLLKLQYSLLNKHTHKHFQHFSSTVYGVWPFKLNSSQFVYPKLRLFQVLSQSFKCEVTSKAPPDIEIAFISPFRGVQSPQQHLTHCRARPELNSEPEAGFLTTVHSAFPLRRERTLGRNSVGPAGYSS